MTSRFRQWLRHKWMGQSPDLVKDYVACFNTPHGIRVLQHLLDNIYSTVYEGTDAQAALTHNARRAVVHEILENIDAGEHPQKYNVTIEKVEN